MKKRFLAMLLCIVLAVGVLPVSAFGIEENNNGGRDKYKDEIISIEVAHETSMSLIENTYGYFNEDNVFIYDTYILSDAVFKINYSDGHSENAHLGDWYNDFKIDIDQEIHPLKIGHNNAVVKCGNVQTILSVTVIPNPVDHIEINRVPTCEYVYGDASYGWCSPDGSYTFLCGNISGLRFTVFFTDGTTKQYEYIGSSNWGNINGYEFWAHVDYENPTTEPAPVVMKLEYMGKTVDFTVYLKESPVESIKILRSPIKTEYAYTEIVYDGTPYTHVYYDPDWRGMEFEIKYKNGTSEIVALTDGNTYWDVEVGGISPECYFEVNGYSGEIIGNKSEGYSIIYLGASCPINAITYFEGQTIRSVEISNFSLLGIDTVFDITYEDNTTERLVLDDIVYCGYTIADGLYITAVTSHGMLNYDIHDYYYTDDEGYTYKADNCYWVIALGQDPQNVEHRTQPSGDVDGDGKISNTDLIILARYVVNLCNPSTKTGIELFGDMNGDGVITNADIITIARIIVGLD